MRRLPAPFADLWWDEDGQLRLTEFEDREVFFRHLPRTRVLSYDSSRSGRPHWNWTIDVAEGRAQRLSKSQLTLALAAAGIHLDLPDSLWP